MRTCEAGQFAEGMGGVSEPLPEVLLVCRIVVKLGIGHDVVITRLHPTELVVKRLLYEIVFIRCGGLYWYVQLLVVMLLNNGTSHCVLNVFCDVSVYVLGICATKFNYKKKWHWTDSFSYFFFFFGIFYGWVCFDTIVWDWCSDFEFNQSFL